LDESGRPTPKYFAFRDVIAKHTSAPLPPGPPSDSTIAVAPFELTDAASLWQTLGAPVHVQMPRSMETFGQSYGYIDYRTTLHGPTHGTLAVHDVRDYAQIYLNGTLVGALDRRLAQDSIAIDAPDSAARLDILVENSGRVNFAKPLRTERKGITRSVTLDGRALTGWDVFTLPMSTVPSPQFGAGTPNGPAFYRGTFRVDRPGDTFLDLRDWGKGTVWVNGHQLGRFWDIGPEQTLYLPGPWLRRGANDVVVFDLVTPARRTLAGLRAPILSGLTASR